MDAPDDMRAGAAKARRLAETTTAPLTIERLRQLAAELEARAEAEERSQKS